MIGQFMDWIGALPPEVVTIGACGILSWIGVRF